MDQHLRSLLPLGEMTQQNICATGYLGDSQHCEFYSVVVARRAIILEATWLLLILQRAWCEVGCRVCIFEPSVDSLVMASIHCQLENMESPGDEPVGLS